MAVATKKKSALAGGLGRGTGKPAAAEKQAAKSGGKTNWFAAGWNAADAGVKKQEKEWEENRNAPRRFWIKANEDGKILFLDSAPITFREHEFAPGGDWKKRVHKICLATMGAHCPFCESDNRGYFCGAMTVVHLTSFTGRDKKEYHNPIKLFVAKTQALKLLNKIAEKKGGDLAGWIFEVSRSGEKSPSCGDIFTPVKRVNVKDPKVFASLKMKAAPKPLNYAEVLKPMSQKDAKAWLTDGAMAASGDDDSDEEVTF